MKEWLKSKGDILNPNTVAGLAEDELGCAPSPTHTIEQYREAVHLGQS